MAIVLITVPDGRRNVYIREDTDNDGHIILHRECSYRVIQALTPEGKTTFSLLDEDGKTNTDIHYYINIKMFGDGRSPNSRRKAIQVLSKFYSFMKLMDYNPYALGQDEIQRLVVFFRGTGRTQSSNDTVNAYLSIIREYFRSLNIRCDTLFDRRINVRRMISENDFRTIDTFYTYTVNLPSNPHKNERVPKYISLDQYIRLQEIAKQHHDWTAIVLMHLMFRYGMRLGECLGLTEEDITIYRIKDKDVPTLIIRNRLSDRPDQHAKGKIIPRQATDYAGNPYIEQWRDDPYSHYYLTESEDSEFIQAFYNYVKSARERGEKKPENYKTCEADIVNPETFREKGLKTNHYIFTNRLSKRLSAQLWGIILRGYFVEAGIPLDKGKKLNNLSHRFRHGFAMMHARFMSPPTPIHELQKMMHHRCISSTLRYYNPTQEDEYELKTELEKKIYDANPSLKSIMSAFLDYPS